MKAMWFLFEVVGVLIDWMIGGFGWGFYSTGSSDVSKWDRRALERADRWKVRPRDED